MTYEILIERCADVDIQNGIMEQEEAIEYYLNLPVEKLNKIYREYYGEK